MTRSILRASAPLFCLLTLTTLPLQAAEIRPLPPLRQQAEEQQAWLKKRLTEVLPTLMREQGVDL